MRIGICDDEIESRIQIIRLIETQSCVEEVEIEEFSTLKQLEQCAHPLDILFLDIEVGTENSLEYIEKKCFKLRALTIVLVSSHSCYITKSYQVPIFQFLLKPIQSDIFAYVFKDCWQRYYRLKQHCKLIDEEGKECLIPLNQIVYIQSEHRQMIYYDCKGQCYWGTKQSLVTVLHKLQPFGICQISKGTLINLLFVVDIKELEVILKVKREIRHMPIGKKYFDEVKLQYLRYLAIQGEK